jgi:DNA-binding NarL/FixJ family response regulator
VALVEDQRITREGLGLLIGGSPGFEIRGQYASMEHALAQIRGNPPGVLLADIGLPGMSGIDGVRRGLRLSAQRNTARPIARKHS